MNAPLQIARDVIRAGSQAAWLRVASFVLIGILSCVLLLDLWRHSELYQSDLRAYYYAGKAYAAGLDPYSTDDLLLVAGEPIHNGFVYPPITLPAFRLMSELPYPLLYHSMLAAKALLLGLLLAIWAREFLGRLPLSFMLFAAIAYNASIYVDMRVGNLSIPEQVAIWIGLSFFARGRLIPFALLIVFASLLKVTPILLLLLLLTSSDKRRHAYLAISAGMFVGIQLASLASNPALFGSFLKASTALSDTGVVNPSTLGFVQIATATLASIMPGSLTTLTTYLGFLILAGAVGLVAYRVIRNLPDSSSTVRALWLTYLGCLTYGLILPRFKTYSYMLVLVPTYVIATEFGRAVHARYPKPIFLEWLPLLSITLLSSIYVPIYGMTVSESSILGYAPLVALAVSWGLFVTGIGIRKRGWLSGYLEDGALRSGCFGSSPSLLRGAR